ncbi:MAG: DsrE family protein [Gudongella sp.]|nr:DsrE family protein [Gudongella sp.]
MDKIIDSNEKLTVLWTSGDREVALKMLFLYTISGKAKGWWQDINIIIWGPSAKLLSEDEELKQQVSKAMHVGITFEACRACADMYGVIEELEKLGIDVKYMGEPLTRLLKEKVRLITL